MKLNDLGWDAYFAQHFESRRDDGSIPARVARVDRERYLVWCEHGELVAEVSGRFRFQASSRGDYPAAGDWVVIQARPSEGGATISEVLPRRSRFSRKVAGERTEEQVVAANVDTIFLVSGLDREFNLRRIERYLTLAWGSGATPVVILNKSDISPDLESRVAEVQAVAVGVSIHPLSAALGLGLEQLAPYFAPGRTVALLGSSGVGKSTLINRLLGEDLLPVQSVRESDDRGRHTTSRRELVLLPSGALIIDTPGLREVQLWSDEEGVGGAFGDIEDLARGCRFRDCTHTHEAGCAVKEASTSGTLLPARLKSYRKLQRELRHLAFRQSFRRMQEEKAKWKRTSKWIKEREKTRG